LWVLVRVSECGEDFTVSGETRLSQPPLALKEKIMSHFYRWNAAIPPVVFLSAVMLIAGMTAAQTKQRADKATPIGDKTSEQAANSPQEESRLVHPLRASLDSGRDVSVFLCLQTEIVRRELGLTDAQKEKITPLLKELLAWSAKTKAGKTEEASVEFVKRFKAVLNPRQIDRLLEIRTQTAVMTWALDNETTNVLELTEDQKAKVKSITHDALKSLSKVDTAIYSSQGTTKDDFKDQQKAIFGKELPILKKGDEAIEKILTSEQREMLHKMRGKEVDLAKLHAEIIDASWSAVQVPPPRTQTSPVNETATRQPTRSPQEKAEEDRKRTAAGGKNIGQWHMVLDLDVPGLPSGEPVQFSMFDEDPIPAFIAEVKRMRRIDKKRGQSISDNLREAAIVVSWNAGFKKITGDQVGVLRNGAPHPAGGFGPTGVKKWIVTKEVRINGKPVCWCLPIELKPVDPKVREIESVDLNEKTMIDLHALFDKAIQDSNENDD
jgi:hypothetical protein